MEMHAVFVLRLRFQPFLFQFVTKKNKNLSIHLVCYLPFVVHRPPFLPSSFCLSKFEQEYIKKNIRNNCFLNLGKFMCCHIIINETKYHNMVSTPSRIHTERRTIFNTLDRKMYTLFTLLSSLVCYLYVWNVRPM